MQIRVEMLTHSHGVHGIDKGSCLYCNSSEPESEYCATRTVEAARKIQVEAAAETLAKKVKARLTRDEWDAVTYVTRNYIGTDWPSL